MWSVAGILKRPGAQVPTKWHSVSPVHWGAEGRDETPPCPLQARLREWASHSPSTALTHPLPPLPQLSVLESALGLDKLFPLHMSEQTERGIPDWCWPTEQRVCADSPAKEPCPYLPPPSPLKLTFLHPAERTRNLGVPPSFCKD